MCVIRFTDVRKEYKARRSCFLAVDNISFQIAEGEILGLVGPNGAGKSTIVKMLCGILTPTSGSVSVLGMDPCKSRKKLSYEIGVMFGNRSSLWYNIPAIESVLLMQSIYHIEKSVFQKRLEIYSKILNLTDILDKPVRQMSLGQKIRTELLVTVLHHPRMLILDEPTLGLDIVTKLQFREMLMDLARESRTTVVLTTHDIDDVQKICHRVVLINKGHKLIDLKKEELNELLERYEAVYIGNDGSYDWSSQQYYREKTEQWFKFFVPKADKKEFMDSVLKKSDYDLQIKTEKVSLEDILYEYYS